MDLSPEDIEVIKAALRMYLNARKREFHHAAAEADMARTLELSMEYGKDQEYICGLLRRVGDGTMSVTSSHTESKGNDSD
jgi:HD-like signal output (HDOD) protein